MALLKAAIAPGSGQGACASAVAQLSDAERAQCQTALLQAPCSHLKKRK